MPPKDTAMRSLNMPLDIDDELRLIAARHNVSKSDLMRGAVSIGLTRLKAKPLATGDNTLGAADPDVVSEFVAAGSLT